MIIHGYLVGFVLIYSTIVGRKKYISGLITEVYINQVGMSANTVWFIFNYGVQK